MATPGVWLIGGPTASGKSDAALALAEATGAEIVNADALQVYADLRILSARPTAGDEARAPHHLYGAADAGHAWSAGRWLRAALPVLEGIAARGRPAIVVGGTGLYLRALTHGLAATPTVPDAVRADIEARWEADGEPTFRARLAHLDPEAEARIASGDRQRLVRAAAVVEASGRPLSAWARETQPALAPGSWRGVVVSPPRADLYGACDARLPAMLAAGALDEVARLLARGLAPTLPAMKAVGVREFAAHLRGETTVEEALDLARRETRRLAKRQLTWFRNQTADWVVADEPDPLRRREQVQAALNPG